MIDKKIISIKSIPTNLLSNIENRDTVLWIRDLGQDIVDKDALVAFLGLPWRLIFMEVYEPELVKAIEAAESSSDLMTRKRGFVQVIDSDPSRIELPQRCLPIYLLNGRQVAPDAQIFENRLRRMTMLESLRRSGTREILVISGSNDPIPQDLQELWSSGFRSYLTFVSDAINANRMLDEWLEKTDSVKTASFLQISTIQVVRDILARYTESYPENRQVIRIREYNGNFQKIDVTEADEPERPILEYYSLIEERDLTPLMPEELSEESFINFFQNTEVSWQPYAAGLPWIRDGQSKTELKNLLKKLDTNGAEQNCIAYIASESGAGGTTLSRVLAWEYAREGYPVLLAKPIPFIPDALPIVNFLHRVHSKVEDKTTQSQDSESLRRYETPWIIVFDSLHWHSRDSELTRFRNELEKSGRPVCILIVTGTMLGLSFYNTSIFKKVAELNHALELSEAQNLGHHLNKFLRCYGKERKESQWNQFYENHSIRYLEGISAFWVTLSFWIQGQYDLSESIQEWIYRSFKANAKDELIQEAILEIAALSSEHIPLAEVLLPKSKGRWPVSHLLEDDRSKLAALGLVRISTKGEKYWALIHDILGRFLINALFYDFPMREKLGFTDAKDAEYLRFLLLRKISEKSVLKESAYRAIGEDFATSIFKIDPDHGHGGHFAPFWREILNALDNMPKPLRDTSRVFRHHTAISRRRIAKFDEKIYGVTNTDKLHLLKGAIEDINYALNYIEYTSGSESNLNLYNSLANAYLDLAKIEAIEGASYERITELRQLANDATRKAYDESPTNSFVIETYVKNLLESARSMPELAIEQCIEALGILFSASTSNEIAYRRAQLGSLADDALKILFEQPAVINQSIEPKNAIDVLVSAWKALATDNDLTAIELADISENYRKQALEILKHPAGQGNMLVLRLSYDLICLDSSYDTFKQQLAIVEQLAATDYRLTPQLRLEYAILLFQNNRAAEGNKIFHSLRKLWRENEHFVHVPERLRWLWAEKGGERKVKAITGSDQGGRGRIEARVQDFGNILVPFRPEEFSIREQRPGTPLECHVTFGHKGPFLRPTTAHAKKGE